MARPKNKTGDKLPHIRVLRLSERMDSRLRTAAIKLGEAEADAHRLALDVGLQVLHLVDYDMPGAIVTTALQHIARKQQRPK